MKQLRAIPQAPDSIPPDANKKRRWIDLFFGDGSRTAAHIARGRFRIVVVLTNSKFKVIQSAYA
jgi:hypothetical protein